MRAELLIDERHVLDDSTFVEIVVWRVLVRCAAPAIVSSIGSRLFAMARVFFAMTMKRVKVTIATSANQSGDMRLRMLIHH